MQYRTLENIRHCGRDIKPGQLIELTESQAAQLLATKAIEPVHRRFEKAIVVPGTTQ